MDKYLRITVDMITHPCLKFNGGFDRIFEWISYHTLLNIAVISYPWHKFGWYTNRTKKDPNHFKRTEWTHFCPMSSWHKQAGVGGWVASGSVIFSGSHITPGPLFALRMGKKALPLIFIRPSLWYGAVRPSVRLLARKNIEGPVRFFSNSLWRCA